ncbi:MAG: amidohydrolase family protein [Acidimicrobiales bacterium]|jgi:imidazolonepropionase-like amidohydrolase|nr:amidohydrolase family protein [Acidimicrobiales bacterium]MDP6893520.1 amidohydrolase family protein [Verrucomicrobiota bacterium]|tara:strand:- start:9 stop:1289 length:1281 start_codon:yes stop_codon:yes gene_type:complete
MKKKTVFSIFWVCFFAHTAFAQDFVLQAGNVIDVEAGRVIKNQSIVISNGRIVEIGNNVTVPEGAEQIDLRHATVMPGLMDAHTHMALSTVDSRDFGRYYFTSLLEPTAFRAIQGVANSRAMLESGFTTIRDVGNNAYYADVALRRAITDGWIPGPHMLTAGRIIAPFGGQFTLQPEKQDLAEPEYFFADTKDEILKAVRQNIHFGATVIKLVVNGQKYIYSEEDVRLAVEEAKKVGIKVAAHATTDASARNAILGGAASIEHGWLLSDEILTLMKEKNVYLVGTDFPLGSYYAITEENYQVIIDRLKRAYKIGTPIAFGTDVVYYKEGKTRGTATLDFLQSFEDAGIPPLETLRMMTLNTAKLLGVDGDRGAIKVGLRADLIAVTGEPHKDLQAALKRVEFVMKSGEIYKKDGRFQWETPTKIGH